MNFFFWGGGRVNKNISGGVEIFSEGLRFFSGRVEIFSRGVENLKSGLKFLWEGVHVI